MNAQGIDNRRAARKRRPDRPSSRLPCLKRASRDAPRLYVVDHFANNAEIAHILAVASNLPALRRRGIVTSQDATGDSFELPVRGDEILERLCARVYATVGIENDRGETLRFRRYRAGQSHPLHSDSYRAGDSFLIVTAMLYLADTQAGGETHFPNAKPRPLRLKPRKGRLVVWFNHLPNGQVDSDAVHESLPVRLGEKVTLTNFIYRPLSYARTETTDKRLRPTPPEPKTSNKRSRAKRLSGSGQPAPKVKFYCVNDGVPAETTSLLRNSCAARKIEYLEIDAPLFDYDPASQLTRGDLLYRPAVSLAAIRVEQFLFNEGVATFHAEADAIFYDCLTSPLVYQRKGLPIPRTVFCATADRRVLRGYIEQLGGFPIVLKLLGRSSGIGVIRVDSFPAFFSLMDHCLAQGSKPALCAFVPDAVHWRVIVIGNRAVAAYRNQPARDDFRTYASDEISNYNEPINPALADLAVSAVHALKHEFGGVDILAQPDGRLFLLESNFPCYFPQAQLVAGIDISGMMIEHLLKKALNY
jgi:RimK-like ATP-grasp domain/2OG-Fe(II) oxygenase superfamily